MTIESLNTRSFRSTLVLVACASILAGCQSPEERFAEHVNRAEQYAETGDRDEAILEYISALGVDPTSAEINERVGLLLTRQGALENAARHFLEAYNLDPNRIESAMHHAQLIAWTNRDRADRLVADALSRAPDESIVHRTISSLALIDGDTRAALDAAQKAAEIDPNDAENWIQLGRAQQGRISQAQKGSSPVPDDAFIGAIDAFTKADEIRDGDVGVRLERARVMGSWPGHGSEAVRAYEETLGLAKSLGEMEQQVLAAHAMTQYAVASNDLGLQVRGLREIVEASPDDIQSWQSLAQTSEELRPGSSDEVFAELARARPYDPKATRARANFLMQNGRFDEGVSVIQAAVDTGNANPRLYDDLVLVRLQLRQPYLAQRALDELLEIEPEHPSTKRAAARMALAQGRNGKAVELLRANPATLAGTEGQRLLALAEFRRGKLTEATAAINRAISHGSEFPLEAMKLKARIHHENRNWILVYRTLTEITNRGYPLNDRKRLMVAQSLYETGRRHKGKLALYELLSADEPLAEAAVEFAKREATSHPRAAQMYLTEAYRQDPSRYSVLEAMTDLDQQNGRTERSLKRVQKAIADGRGGPRTLLLQARLLTDAGELDQAEREALRVFEAVPSLPGAIELLLRIYRTQGNVAEAQRSFEEAEAAGVLHAGGRRLLAGLYAAQSETSKARALLEVVVEGHPNMAGARSDLAILLADEGSEPDRAIQLARDARKQLPADPNAAFALGYALFRKGLYEGAVTEYTRAISLDRQQGSQLQGSLYYYRGLALRALDRKDEARSSFSTALGAAVDFPEAEEAKRQLDALETS
ncbi:tetratricopeptide repeat protein [Myxococcota bacterium]|nr:tetratricopeptide repeat protein [Myxococcota bacterium]